MTREDARKILDDANAALGEHFDAVQINASWMKEDGSGDTLSVHRGIGNWHARRSLSQEFIEIDQQASQAQEIANRIDPPGDSEDWKKA